MQKTKTKFQSKPKLLQRLAIPSLCYFLHCALREGTKTQIRIVARKDRKLPVRPGKAFLVLLQSRDYFPIKVLQIRLEHLQSISERDAQNSGIEESSLWTSCREHFQAIWEYECNGRIGYRWEDNPEVWVIDFILFNKEQS